MPIDNNNSAYYDKITLLPLLPYSISSLRPLWYRFSDNNFKFLSLIWFISSQCNIGYILYYYSLKLPPTPPGSLFRFKKLNWNYILWDWPPLLIPMSIRGGGLSCIKYISVMQRFIKSKPLGFIINDRWQLMLILTIWTN